MTSKMTINKYQGKTKEEAIEKAKQELGEGAVVMNVKEIKPTGMFKAWKSSVFEVTAAREEKESFVDPRQVADLTAKTVKTLNLAADENISPKEFSNDRTSDILSGHLTNVPELHAKDGLEKRLENLSNILEKQLSVEESRQKEVKEEEKERQVVNPEGLQFIKMLYRTLLENEVNEKYCHATQDFKEYVEMWIHEIKLPIASMTLILHNYKEKFPDVTERMTHHVNRVNNYLEQILYYVRSENAQKDYIISDCRLSKLIAAVAVKNKDDILENNIDFQVENADADVCTDSKWLEFILNQIISNSIKYRDEKKTDGSVIKIYVIKNAKTFSNCNLWG